MRLGKGVWGIGVGCVVGVALVVVMVLSKGLDGGRDPASWAWIDVVSRFDCRDHCQSWSAILG